jgi:hypothetical protein
MGYDPTIGRWLEQDPIDDLAEHPEMLGVNTSVVGSQGNNQNPVVSAIEGAINTAVGMFGKEAVMSNLHLLKDVNGPNTYQFEESNPVNADDPSGLDRYVVDGGLGHHGIAVDQWTVVNGQWVKTGVVTYDFSLNYWYLWAGATQLAGLPAGGKVKTTPGINGKIQSTIPSCPQADMALDANMVAAAINPPLYSLAYYNCNWFVQNHLLDGINTGPTPPAPAHPPAKTGPPTGPTTRPSTGK